MKEELNKLMKKFKDDICSKNNNRYFRHNPKPTFENFICWLDDRHWDIE